MTPYLRQILTAAILVSQVLPNEAFSAPIVKRQDLDTGAARRSSVTPLRVIKSDDADFIFDEGAGGVRLAMESVIKVAGNVKHKPGNAEPIIKELIRYTALIPVKESTVKESLEKLGATIVCTGSGKELYKDPGQSTEALIVLAPSDAVRDALTGAGSAMNAGTLVVNFAGGDDVQVLEVLDATKQLVLMLDVPTKAKIVFNSISCSEFALGSSTVTVIALPEEISLGGLKYTDKSIATGEVYFCNGVFQTLVEENINTAVA